MSNFQFRPAVRENAPLIVGIAGPSKSGKTFSALRMATGLAGGGKIAMINTEGKRGYEYADKFKYEACDLNEPFSMERYVEALGAANELKPAVTIVDGVSHAHEGIGGMLDQHEAELDRFLKGDKDYKKRERLTWAAWVRPKKDEAQMINTMIQMDCHLILCFRAKEKLKILKGKEPVPLGWQPIGSDRIHFETAFTLILPPHSKGKPDFSAQGSEFREPYDTMVKEKQIDEDLGKRLAEYAAGQKKEEKTPEVMDESEFKATKEELGQVTKALEVAGYKTTTDRKAKIVKLIGKTKVEDITRNDCKEILKKLLEEESTPSEGDDSTPY